MRKSQVITALEYLKNKEVDKFQGLFWVNQNTILGFQESIQLSGTPSTAVNVGFDIISAHKMIKLLDGDEVIFTDNSITDGTEILPLKPRPEGPAHVFPTDYEFSYDGKTLLDAIKKVKFAKQNSTHNRRFEIHNILLDKDRLVATDGHRLAWADVTHAGNMYCGRALMSGSVMAAIEKFKPEIVFISLTPDHKIYYCLVSEATDGQTITIEIKGENNDYADYERVMIDWSSAGYFAVDRKKLETKLTPVTKALDANVNKGSFSVNGSLQIVADSLSKVIPVEILETSGEYCGPSTEGTFLLNLRYFLDAIKQTSKDILYLSMPFSEGGACAGKPMLLRFTNPDVPWNELSEGSIIMPLRA